MGEKIEKKEGKNGYSFAMTTESVPSCTSRTANIVNTHPHNHTDTRHPPQSPHPPTYYAMTSAVNCLLLPNKNATCQSLAVKTSLFFFPTAHNNRTEGPLFAYARSYPIDTILTYTAALLKPRKTYSVASGGLLRRIKAVSVCKYVPYIDF